MNRTGGLMVLCVVLGAAVMYGGSNFRIRVEPVAAPEAKTPLPAPQVNEPGRLPEQMTAPRAEDRVRRDGNVRPAATMAPEPKPDPVTVVRVEDAQGIVWKPETFPTAGVPAFGTTLTLRLNRPVGLQAVALSTDDLDQKTVPIDDSLPGAKRSEVGGVTVVTLDLTKLKANDGAINLRFQVKDQNTFSDPHRLTVLLSSVATADRSVLVTEYTNSPYLRPVRVADLTDSAPAEVYGKPQYEPYIRLFGSAAGAVSAFRFFLQPDGGTAFEVDGESINRDAGGAWNARVKLPVLADSLKAKLFVRAEYANGRVFAAPVPLRFNYIPAALDAPALDVPTSPEGKAVVAAPEFATPGLPAYYSNGTKFDLKVKPPANAQVLVAYVDSDSPLFPGLSATTGLDGNSKATFAGLEVGAGRDHVIRVAAVRGTFVGPVAQIKLLVSAQPPAVEDVIPQPGFGQSGGVGVEKITIRFNARSPLDKASVLATTFKVIHVENTGREGGNLVSGVASFDPVTNSVTLNVKAVLPGTYRVVIVKSVLKDVFGNFLPQSADVTDQANAFEFVVATQPVGDKALPSQRVGVTLQTGPQIPLPEYVKFRISPDGFNPSDRVETRVMRLYYFRDAHRVAQIVNRTVKSYNAATVEVRRRAADRSRDDANKAEDERKVLEAAAVRAAQDARAAEAELGNAQSRLATNRAQLEQARQVRADGQRRLDQLAAAGQGGSQQAADIRAEIARADSVIASTDAIDRQGPTEIARLQGAVAAKRDAEAKAIEQWQVKELQERRLRENQFRIEVAAAKEDPDTYAPPQPLSDDPVLQVSISVIGEGLIQLRGPIKGLNVIRTMVNQIDAPVGQVRVSVHTLQVNGERADRMEKVVQDIQRYLDHSRFLTAQSAQMLRRAVTLVASRKAAEVRGAIVPGHRSTQAERDLQYLYSFFGQDFTDELAQIDSEFLKTGNKLLALNSMDSTSLSAALFLMALAKNDVRREIIDEFLAMLQKDLPQAEWTYYQAGFSDLKWKQCDACKDKKQYMLAYNAKFQSFIGFFTSESEVADALSPLQREFIRLAQIFKARMITEIQLKQRVMERALLEERFGGSYKEMAEAARKAEKEANDELRAAQEYAAVVQAQVTAQIQLLLARLDAVVAGFEKLRVPKLVEFFETRIRQNRARLLPPTIPKATDGMAPAPKAPEGIEFRTQAGDLPGPGLTFKITYAPDDRGRDDYLVELQPAWRDFLKEGARQMREQLGEVVFFDNLAVAAARVDALLALVLEGKETISFRFSQLKTFDDDVKELIRGVAQQAAAVRAAATSALARLAAGDVPSTLTEMSKIEADLTGRVKAGGETEKVKKESFGKINELLQQLAAANAKVAAAKKKALLNRRPIDEKKLLDMIVDEMEDKFIEILEGTRAHTANIDNYMKTVATALDDDFNTQYYLPSFRRARDASRYWDVTLSQIETTSVLANNRTFAKVSPAATFEFDLPRRQILLTEGFKSAKALVDEYGALVNDPSFLSLAKMASGNPVSMMSGTGGNLSAVRNVLPGLPSSPDERVMAQAGPGRKEFGSALEALIPDPAIYKFETGTGFEIRPVLSPDGQAVVFNFDYMYTTDVREPVRADEKHLGRVKRHFVHTDVQLSNFELREVSKYLVSLKVARTAKGVQLLQDIPGVGVLFRPLPSAGASLQQNLIYSQATIFPTLFDLMGLRYAPAVADLDPLADQMAEFAARYRKLDIEQRVGDIATTRVDDALRTPYGERRYDLYRPQVSIPYRHPNGYIGPGLRLKDGKLVEGYDYLDAFPPSEFNPGVAPETRVPPYDLSVPYQLPGQPRPYLLPGMPPPGAKPLPNPRPLPGPHSMAPTIPGTVPTALPTAKPPTEAMLLDPRVPINYGKPVPFTPPSAGAGVPKVQDVPSTHLPPVITPAIPPAMPPLTTPPPTSTRPTVLPPAPAAPPAPVEAPSSARPR